MRLLPLFLAIFLFLANCAYACDPCSLYLASKLQGHTGGDFTLAISEQYTDFDKANGIEENSSKDAEFVRGFSTTQFSLAYDISDIFGLQVTLPVLARRYDEVDNYRANTSNDQDIGDASLIAAYEFYNNQTESWNVIAGLYGGVKLPTGDTGVLENVVEEEEHLEEDSGIRHHSISSASGGKALTFGSGSYDYILGLNFLSSYESYLVLSNAQYTVRTEGDFDYEFADDFLWSVGGGYYLLSDHEFTLAALIALSSEYKAKDHLGDEIVEGSQVSNLYLGPQILLTMNENVGAEIGLDFRITGEDVNASVVPETRFNASLSYRF